MKLNGTSQLLLSAQIAPWPASRIAKFPHCESACELNRSTQRDRIV